ncbi:MAG: nucleoside triphosphate pyrophosphohydrolase [Chloroflexota bacterium]
MAITIVGLGPGDASLITRQAWHLLTSTGEVWVRTSRHPAVDELPDTVTLHSFDAIYDNAEDFSEVYTTIAETVIGKGRTGGIVYAVPGNPFVGEATVQAIVAAARDESVAVELVAGLSFVEPVLAALQVDALDGLQLFDAITVGSYLYPPINPDVPLLLGQVYSRLLANELKLSLVSIYPPDHQVALVHHAGQADEIVESVSLYEFDRSEQIDHLTSLYIPTLPVKAGLPTLAETVAILRSPNGCPWDQEQTPQSMREGFLEEAYEVIAALDAEDIVNLREELGDLMYHIVMQAQMAAEAEEFTLTDVIAGIEAKLKRRHPHVWGDWEVSDTAQVLLNWEKLKQQEKADQGDTPASILDNVPLVLPALARSEKIQSKVAKVGFDWPDVDGVYAKIAEEIEEVQTANSAEEQMAEIGDLLFAVTNLARWYHIDAESALREANIRFSGRFRVVEQLAAERNLSLADLDINELEALWQEAKATVARNSLTDTV